MRSIFKLTLAEGFVDRDPTGALYTPKQAAIAERPTMTKEEVEQYISILETRERVIAHLAIFCGMRPGEILALQRRHIATDCKSLRIDQRLYRGDIDTPKTNSSTRTVAIPPKTAHQLRSGWSWQAGSPKHGYSLQRTL